ncbi:hypothetical protein TNCV_624561 [Trichonephila clavipes]|nr:hypothetical protein TNCV_624561 [Trichonephila clavipes]
MDLVILSFCQVREITPERTPRCKLLTTPMTLTDLTCMSLSTRRNFQVRAHALKETIYQQSVLQQVISSYRSFPSNSEEINHNSTKVEKKK